MHRTVPFRAAGLDPQVPTKEQCRAAVTRPTDQRVSCDAGGAGRRVWWGAGGGGGGGCGGGGGVFGGARGRARRGREAPARHTLGGTRGGRLLFCTSWHANASLRGQSGYFPDSVG